MSRPSKRVAPICPVRFYSCKRSKVALIPDLPDDILRMIIEELPTADRALFSLVSKRYMHLDREVGKRRFKKIDISMEKIGADAVAHTASGRYIMRAKSRRKCKKVVSSEQRLLLFRASTDILTIFVKFGDKRSALSLSSLIRLIRYQKIVVCCRAPMPSFSFLSGLKTDRNELDVVCLYWDYKKEDHALTMKHYQQKLPKIRELQLLYMIGNKHVPVGPVPGDDDQERFLVNGATMLHLIRNSDEVFLRSTDCTVHDLLDAFKVVSQSQIDSKFISIHVHGSVIDDLFALTEESDEFEVSQRRNGRSLIDINNVCELFVSDERKDVFHYIFVAIYKIDSHGNSLSKRIVYQ